MELSITKSISGSREFGVFFQTAAMHLWCAEFIHRRSLSFNMKPNSSMQGQWLIFGIWCINIRNYGLSQNMWCIIENKHFMFSNTRSSLANQLVQNGSQFKGGDVIANVLNKYYNDCNISFLNYHVWTIIVSCSLDFASQLTISKENIFRKIDYWVPLLIEMEDSYSGDCTAVQQKCLVIQA